MLLENKEYISCYMIWWYRRKSFNLTKKNWGYVPIDPGGA